jgi:hypothetical protein
MRMANYRNASRLGISGQFKQALQAARLSIDRELFNLGRLSHCPYPYAFDQKSPAMPTILF